MIICLVFLKSNRYFASRPIIYSLKFLILYTSIYTQSGLVNPGPICNIQTQELITFTNREEVDIKV